ncbi:MAG: ABC transporter permease subunit, partial [Peptococcaceae bacterium]|nr:ABC transporter permease subunit [Peptococcaceae bacterium]
LLLTFMCSGVIALVPESIAGEKERGTIAALLVTPMKRSHLAAGKILSIGVLSLISGLSSLIGAALSLPKFMNIDDDSAAMISTSVYGAADYLFLALVIFTTLLMLVAVFSIVSAYAKSVKEAGLTLSPFMLVVMAVGLSGMLGFGDGAQAQYYLIPLYNSVQIMNGIFSLDYLTTNVAIVCAANLAYAFAGGFVLTMMFNSEKVMFSK